jgi:hypothetical protein
MKVPCPLCKTMVVRKRLVIFPHSRNVPGDICRIDAFGIKHSMRVCQTCVDLSEEEHERLYNIEVAELLKKRDK